MLHVRLREPTNVSGHGYTANQMHRMHTSGPSGDWGRPWKATWHVFTAKVADKTQTTCGARAGSGELALAADRLGFSAEVDDGDMTHTQADKVARCGGGKECHLKVWLGLVGGSCR